MDTRHLKIFTTVYKTRSFTKAAEELYTSQPTVSEHMRNLEDNLGCKLFDRLGRSIMPTPEAELLYPKAEEILAEMSNLRKTLAYVANHVSGELVIGASTIPGDYILPEHAALFTSRYPEVSFEIRIHDSARIVKDISQHKLYLGVVGAQIPSTKVEYTPFGGDELVLAAAADLSIPGEITADELLQFDFLQREQGSGTGRNIEQFLGTLGISPARLKVRATLGSSTAIKEAIKSALGIAIISRIAIRDELASGRLKEIKIRGLNMQRSFYIVTSRKRTMPNHYLVFANFLKKTAASLQDGSNA